MGQNQLLRTLGGTIKIESMNIFLKVIFYLNTFLDYPVYKAPEVCEKHPEWWLQREFKYAQVWVNLETKNAIINWKE